MLYVPSRGLDDQRAAVRLDDDDARRVVVGDVRRDADDVDAAYCDSRTVLSTLCVMIPLCPSRSLLITPLTGVGPSTLMRSEPRPPSISVVKFGPVPRTKKRSSPAPPSTTSYSMLTKLTLRPAPKTPSA